MGLLMAVVTITLRATQGIAGIGLYMVGWGLSGTLFRNYVGGITSIEGIQVLNIPFLSDIPVLGPMFFSTTRWCISRFCWFLWPGMCCLKPPGA